MLRLHFDAVCLVSILYFCYYALELKSTVVWSVYHPRCLNRFPQEGPNDQFRTPESSFNQPIKLENPFIKNEENPFLARLAEFDKERPLRYCGLILIIFFFVLSEKCWHRSYYVRWDWLINIKLYSITCDSNILITPRESRW